MQYLCMRCPSMAHFCGDATSTAQVTENTLESEMKTATKLEALAKEFEDTVGPAKTTFVNAV